MIYRIPTDCELPFLNITDEYDIEKTIAEGCFAKIFLTTHKPTKSCVVLKACHTELTNVREFIKEFHYNYQLSHHPSILSCYQVTHVFCRKSSIESRLRHLKCQWALFCVALTSFFTNTGQVPNIGILCVCYGICPVRRPVCPRRICRHSRILL